MAHVTSTRTTRRRLALRLAVAVAAVAVVGGGAWAATRPADPRTPPPEDAALDGAHDDHPPTTGDGASSTTAASVDPMCVQPSAPGSMDHHGGSAPGVAVGDGRWERTYGNPNPHIDTSAYPFEQPPTDAERRAAAAFVAEVRTTVERNGWADPERARADGFAPMQTCASHWMDRNAVFDDDVLDPDRPESLIYVRGPDGRPRLESVMFLARTNEEHGPQPFGPVAVWHRHEATGLCMEAGLLIPDQPAGGCPPGTGRYDRTVEMLHVMLEPGADPFATGM